MSETPITPLSESGKEETYRVEGVDTPSSLGGGSGHFELHDQSGSKDSQRLWRSYLEFIQFSLGFSANLGTIWRFPYVLLSSDGGKPHKLYNEYMGSLSDRLPCMSPSHWNATAVFGVGDWANFWPQCDPSVYYASYFPRYNVLTASDDVTSLGGINWKLAFCLVSTWTLTFAGLVKGFESARKITFLTSTVPYILLLVLLIRGATLPGAWTGVETGFKLKWSDLSKLE
ncbi:solute carrier family 6 (neurotransmitter transporter GABA) member 13, partial [Clonorchis sinensis]